MNGRQHPEAERACACPSSDGVIRHQRETCADPVVARLGWYADSQPSAAAPVGGTEPCDAASLGAPEVADREPEAG